MANKEFEELIGKRKDWVRSSRENNFDFDSILAGLYTDPSHFIYELLQNAEDEGAKEIRFELFEDRLDVYHNGKDFDLQDIDGVTGIGISKKKEDLNLIGKFGVGFKSVFAVTQNPYIFSGEYKIKIEDFVIPAPPDVSSTTQKNGTLIRAPFNHKYCSREETFTLIHKRLENLELRTLLFLKNINEIKWKTPSSNGHYLKSAKNVQEIPNTKRVTLVSSSVTEEYLVIRKPIKMECKELWVEVAYKLGKDQNGKEIIVPEPNSKLVVFFPTEKVTFLNFLIQGPYKTTPNRENIPLEDEQNKIILEDTGNLITESLTIIKDLGYLDTNFLSSLPLSSDLAEHEQIYSVIYEKVKEKFLSERLLPTSDSTYTKAGDALLARGKELTEFLNNNDIQNLFSKQNWLDTNITYDKTQELRNYLINELEVIEVDFESFARKITVEFLQTKSDEWMIDFYRRLLDQQSLWSERGYSKGILRTKPIIRLENNEHIAPFDNNGKNQVYLPAEAKSEYKTVKRALTEDEESLKFLKELGLTKPDIFAEIKEFILPKYHTENPVKDEWYFEDFEKLLKGYESIQLNKKEEFVKELSDTPFIYAIKNDNTEESCLLKASQTYFSDDDLKNYFNGYQSVYFVSEELYEKFGEEKVKKFLKDLGVEDKPRRIEIEGKLTWEEKSKLRGNSGCTREIYQRDYEYEGLENFINNITPEKSYLLWKLLLKNIESLSSWDAQKFFEGEYSWFYYSQYHIRFKAKFLKTLKQQAWLVDKDNNFKKPSEITFSELSDDYIKENPNIDILIKALGFKPEIIDLLPECDRKILEIAKARNITPDELEKILSERKEKQLEQQKEQWTPECGPDTPAVRIQEVEPDKIVTDDLSGQIENIEAGSDGKSTTEIEKTEKEVEKTPIDKKAIGKWGEKYVYNVLKKMHQKQGDIIETDSGFKVIGAGGKESEIVWLNVHHDSGKGYDFVVKKNGAETEYIEVKAKTQEKEELIEVTGTQWEFARKLFDQNEGEKYYFYVVLNAGKENAQIRILKNPIKLWKEGKLYAHPINFKL